MTVGELIDRLVEVWQKLWEILSQLFQYLGQLLNDIFIWVMGQKISDIAELTGGLVIILIIIWIALKIMNLIGRSIKNLICKIQLSRVQQVKNWPHWLKFWWITGIASSMAGYLGFAYLGSWDIDDAIVFCIFLSAIVIIPLRAVVGSVIDYVERTILEAIRNKIIR